MRSLSNILAKHFLADVEFPFDFSLEETETLGNSLGIDWSKFSVEEMAIGMAVEMEHGGLDPQTDVLGFDLEAVFKTAWAHLKEDPKYYTKLMEMEGVEDMPIEAVVEAPKDNLADWMYLDPNATEEELRIKPSVRNYLLKIARRVRESMPISDMPWVDIQVVGSSLGYNYTDQSDIDLHFIADLDSFVEKHNFKDIEEARSLLGYMFRFMNVKGLYEVAGHPVEMYWQDDDEENKSPAIYSVVDDEFIKYPEEPEDFDEAEMNRAKKDAKELSDTLHRMILLGDLEGVEEWKEIVRNIRQSALGEDGIFSYGNLVFKFLRGWGDLEKASTYIDKHL
jgi:hypothetical protein